LVATVTTRRTVDGTPYNFGTIKDITERKAREREIRAQNERLDSFAGIASHDLRGPLTVAKGDSTSCRRMSTATSCGSSRTRWTGWTR